MKNKSTINDISLSKGTMDWFEEHSAELAQQFGGQWIAVHDNRVVAHGKRLVDVREMLASQNIASPFMTKIPTQEENDVSSFV